MDPFALSGVGLIIIIVLVALILLRATAFFTVRTQENVIVERFGKFVRVARPGLNFKVPFIESTTKPISLRVQQLEVNIESKTKDNVFVTVPVAVQYVIPESNVRDAYYRLSDPTAQIRSYVFDVVRSALSGLNLDQAFESKDDIATSVERTLSAQMREYGFEIANTLVTDISPDQRVRDSMNSINAAQRDRVAAQSLAEADKIKRVTQAEAEAEAKRLQGVGVAAQRKAIAEGIAEQYEMLRRVGIEATAEQLLLMTQYFDTMQDVARNGRSNVLYLPSNPGAVGGMFEEIRNALLQSKGAEPAFEDAVREGRRPDEGPEGGSTAVGRPAPPPPPRPAPRPQLPDAPRHAQPALSEEQQQLFDRARGLAERFTGRRGRDDES
ncbi:regulator of protease activity HflC (stomatin/prohibitin superfamily) [Naumannella cuiyingiana]|uniref:Regulator of protease activity HflC (Stomatin/prohibitin superfamily) n=1 Tax=Naumannella cuiyingiana TaxID=1347891 RepID=A0A7Z0D923_9ACTN|nr:regulator of protease activity HflC (stomatin/prohibitin superfamily) [Naumannella cuiyingiana]